MKTILFKRVLIRAAARRESHMNYITHLHALSESLANNMALTEEELILLAHYAGKLHSDLLERIDSGLSIKRKETYQKKQKQEEACWCGGKQKPAYKVNGKKMCHQCYIKSRK